MRNWKAIVGTTAVCVVLGFGFLQLYWAVTYGEIRARWGPAWVSREAEPDKFWLAVLLAALGVLVLGGLLAFAFWAWRSERRWLPEKGTSPPIDKAIRRTGDANI